MWFLTISTDAATERTDRLEGEICKDHLQCVRSETHVGINQVHQLRKWDGVQAEVVGDEKSVSTNVRTAPILSLNGNIIPPHRYMQVLLAN